jgi:hypothetical protein
MKLTELAKNDYFKGLVYGASGAGKTCFAAKFAELGPVEFWDFDHKISSAANFYADNAKILNNIEVLQFANKPEKERIPAFLERTKQIDTLIAAKKELPFKTLVLDSITTFTNILMRDYLVRSYTMLKRPLPELYGQQDYGILATQLKTIIPNLLVLPCNVIVLGHVESDKDELTGIISRQPMMPGKNAPTLPIWFEEVYVAKLNAKGERVLQTQPDKTYGICRSQRKGLAAEIPMNLDFLGVK